MITGTYFNLYVTILDINDKLKAYVLNTYFIKRVFHSNIDIAQIIIKNKEGKSLVIRFKDLLEAEKLR